jgi:hypothetical protein
MCNCIIAILLADLLTLSLLYTAFVELNIHDEHYNIANLVRTDFEFEGKEEARITIFSYLIALVIHTLSTIIKYVCQLLCCCDCCCCSCGRMREVEVIYV